MKENLQALIKASLKSLQEQQVLPETITPNIVIDRTKNPEHGDFSCNIALMLAKPASKPPRQLAELIIENLPASDEVIKMDIAGPGFINFFLSKDLAQSIVKTVLTQGGSFGHSQLGKGKRVLVEFVSANPNGPLHVGHGRGAAYGATIADLLEAIGYQVDREYYVNDAGRQMHILAVSVWLRYLALFGESCPFPNNGYQGDYVIGIAEKLKANEGDALHLSCDEIFECVKAINDDEDKEAYVDALIVQAKAMLGDKYQALFNIGLTEILQDIKADLEDYGVVYQNWFSEQSLMDANAVEHGIQKLTELGFVEEIEGALWFKSTEFGDDKDRVLKRKDGRTTYFASDVAYHLNKVERGYDFIIDVFGADHHGYVTRVRAAMRALGVSDKNFVIPLVQFASLYRNGEKLPMSTRTGSFVTLRELRDEIGKDAARFFYVMRRMEQHLDFDLDLAKSQSNENPVYYMQYAHARICSVMLQLKEKQMSFDQELGLAHLDLLTIAHEQAILKLLTAYPEALEKSASQYEPHILINFLRELANAFHAYYNAAQFIVEDDKLRCARLCLAQAVKQVLLNGLTLLNVSSPEKM